jgi:EAL domain-containing protein (putative c-di-GMP-specific phosphodiesterase class I)
MVGSDFYTRQIAEDLKAANLAAGTLTLEITEQAAVSSLARANEMIRHWAPWGCRLALDDFGTGSNSLTYLNALPIALVKIDGSFVRDIVTNPRSQATVRGIVELARGFAIDTVAEYVENEAIAQKVRALGVDYAQGDAFGLFEPLDSVWNPPRMTNHGDYIACFSRCRTSRRDLYVCRSR